MFFFIKNKQKVNTMSSIAPSTSYFENEYWYPPAEELRKKLQDERYNVLLAKISRSSFTEETFISELADKTLTLGNLCVIKNRLSPMPNKDANPLTLLIELQMSQKLLGDIEALGSVLQVEKSLERPVKTAEKKSDTVDEKKKNGKPQKDESRCVIM